MKNKKTKLIPMTEEEEYRNAGITKEEINKYKKAIDEEDFYTIEKTQKAYWKNFEDINKERNKNENNS